MNYVVNIDTQVKCPHGGGVQFVLINPRLFAMNVRVVGVSVVTMQDKYPIIASPCPLAQAPCVEVIWVMGARRVTVKGSPVILFDSDGKCSPTMPPKVIPKIQTRVRAT